MGKKKGKKGKAQDDGQASGAQEKSQPGSSRQEGARVSQEQKAQEQLPKQSVSQEQVKSQETGEEPWRKGQPPKQRGQQLTKQLSHETSPTHGHGDGPEIPGLSKGTGREHQSPQTQKPTRVPGQPKQEPRQVQAERQPQGPWKQEPTQQTAPVQQQRQPQGPWKQEPTQQTAPVQQQRQPQGAWKQEPTQQTTAVQQQRRGPQQPPQPVAPIQQQRRGQQHPPQQYAPPQPVAPVQQQRWGPQQPAQQVAPPQPVAPVQQQRWGPQQPAQQVAPPQPVASVQQRWGPQQPPQQVAPPQQLGSPEPQQYVSPQQREPWKQKPPQSQHVQQLQKSDGRGDLQASIPAEPASPIRQEPEVIQQPKGSQKGKKRGSKQQEGPQQQPSTSQEPLPAQLSKIQITKSETGGGSGGGDAQLLPMQFIRAKPGIKCKRKILIETNHLSLNVGKLKTAIHYDVNLVPDTPKKYLRSVLEIFRKKHYSNRYPAFDGRKNLYSASMLPFKDYIEDEIVLQEPDGREKKYKVQIKFANIVDLTPLQDLLRSEETPREAMQVVDIVLRSAPVNFCIPSGRSFFVKPSKIIQLGEGMEMYNGFYQSAIRGWKPFLNVDVAHKAFPISQHLTDVLMDLFSSYNRPYTRQDLSRPLNNIQKDTLNSYIKTLKITYEIPGHPSSRRAYTVNGLDMPPNTKTFKLDSGEVTTIEKYFEKYKNYTLRYPHLPSLWVGSKQRENKILLPLELCTILADQVVNRKMTETQTSNMIKYAATSTTVRKEKIMTSLRQAKHNSDPAVQEFGFSIGNEFEKIQARVLNPPPLAYDVRGSKVVQPSRGIWRGERFVTGVTIKKWTIACVDRYNARPEDVNKLADMIFRNAMPSGMQIETPAEPPFEHIRSQNQHDIKKYFQTQKGKNFDVIFVIVPNSGPQYSYVKTAAEINVGCLTQCIKSRTLSRMNPQTAINILLKVNSKLNGTNHFLHDRPPIMNKPCMIMGADVTHPSPDARDIPSVAAVTASHDPKAFQYNICWRLQPPKVEIIEDLESIVMEQLKYFYTKTKLKPERIVFFRDGVSEGQFDQVRTAEIRAIRSACKKLQKEDYEPAITFLVVQKRHHTRLFPTDPRDSEDKNCNVPAGTCVDTIITHPFMQDFYLVSHASIQGVAKPTKYCTLWDDNSMTNDDVEQLAYYLCHMFTRCNRSVSYPAPTYYAHLAAARAKVYIENERLDMDRLQQEFSKFQILDEIRKGKPMFFV